MEKKCQKGKWLSEEALQIAVKRRETKSKGEKERYSHLNVEFQKIARRDKKDFLSDQCKEIEENNRMGKTRDLFKKIRDTKGRYHSVVFLYLFSLIAEEVFLISSCYSLELCIQVLISFLFSFVFHLSSFHSYL